MSEAKYALLLGLDESSMKAAAEALQECGFIPCSEESHRAGKAAADVTLFLPLQAEKKVAKKHGASRIVCFANFAGEEELKQLETIQPAAILPFPNSAPGWKDIYREILSAVADSKPKNSGLLVRSLYLATALGRGENAAGKDRFTARDKNQAQSIPDLEKRFVAVQQEMQSFAYSVSHDLRAPLRAVYGFSKILADDFAEALPAEAKSFVDHIMANAHQMSSLLDDLLAFYRLGKNPARPVEWNPTEMLRAAAAELKRAEPNREAEIEIADLPVLWVDPALAETALRHLLNNAWKFTKDKKPATIRMSAVAADGQVEIVCEDNGVGFDLNHASKLFQVFQRMHTSAEFPGNGIGLAMVKKVADMHEGGVWIESVPEQGTKAHLRFPIKAQDLAE
jgi:signal transduction histidine kinase